MTDNQIRVMITEDASGDRIETERGIIRKMNPCVMQSNEAYCIDMACHLGANQHKDDKADVDKTSRATQYELQ